MFEGLRDKLSRFASQFKKQAEQKKSGIPADSAEPEKNVPAPVPETFSEEKTAEPGSEEPGMATKEKTLAAPVETKPMKGPSQETGRELKAKVGWTKKATAVLTGKIEINERDISELLEELELSLLEADVEQETAAEIVSQIKKELTGKKLPAGELDSVLKKEIRKAVETIMAIPVPNLVEESRGKKPFILLLLGPNGAGKTTTLAKLAHYLKQHNKTSVWAAADTFRAASIEQLEKHGQILGMRVIKQAYGADPAAVCFDAIQSAKSHETDFVLIDSAGRQETNKNLMEELKKIVRVAKPDLKIFVAESYSGQALLQQATEFDSALGLDGFILTKIDADPKGGTLLSLLFRLKKPVLFIGTGQGYENLEAFDAKKIAERII